MSTSKKAATPPPERFIVLLRHGIAEDAGPDKKDEDRGLTAEGHKRMKEIARGLQNALPKATAIYSSPLLRAVQTALWVSKGYRSRANVTTTDALVPSGTAKQFLALVKSIQERRAVIIGHEPVLTAGLHALTGVEGVELKKGGCYGVRLRPDGTASLEWVLPPRLLRKLGV
ncbi:MAG TPA: phosphoglycerate mutase family protein [Thermoanaerobaculia bacterium]|nr:phosphoglycerate mutase family protein [Thermoanaerobaculia bacterium]